MLPLPTENKLSPVAPQDFRPKVRCLFTTHPTYWGEYTFPSPAHKPPGGVFLRSQPVKWRESNLFILHMFLVIHICLFFSVPKKVTTSISSCCVCVCVCVCLRAVKRSSGSCLWIRIITLSATTARWVIFQKQNKARTCLFCFPVFLWNITHSQRLWGTFPVNPCGLRAFPLSDCEVDEPFKATFWKSVFRETFPWGNYPQFTALEVFNWKGKVCINQHSNSFQGTQVVSISCPATWCYWGILE